MRRAPPSKPHRAALDALVERRVELHESTRLRIVEIDRVRNGLRIEALTHHVDLLLLEGRGDLDLVLDAHEQRPRILRQVRDEIGVQRLEIATAAAYDRRHTGAAVASGNLDAIDVGVGDAGE